MAKGIIDDTNCCILLSKGSVDAYYYLIQIYFPVMCNFSVNIVKDRMAAEDIAHEVFLKLWVRKPFFKDMLEIKKFLYVSVKNSSLNFLRSQKRTLERNEVFSSSYWQSEDEINDEILFSELLAEVRKAMDTLPKKMRTIFILGYIKQLSNNEIAEQLNLSNQTVRNQKAKSLLRLKKILGPQTLSYVLVIATVLI